MTKKTESVLIEKLSVKNLPELQGWKNTQEGILKDNPFIEIVDNETYVEGKKRRTALLKGRTALLNQDKLIAKKLREFRNQVSEETNSLIQITERAEETQQKEVKAYELKKEEEKAEKERIERDRILKLKSDINIFYNEWVEFINAVTFDSYKEHRDSWKKIIDMDAEYLLDRYEDLILYYEGKVEEITTLFDQKINWIEREEESRIREEKLKKEREEFDAKQREITRQREADQAIIDAENKKKNDEIDKRLAKAKKEEDRLAEIEHIRLAKERDEQLKKEDAIRKEKEVKDKIIADKKHNARLKKLLPDKKKAQTIIDSLKFEGVYSIKDKEIKDLMGAFAKDVALLMKTYTDNLNVITK